MADVANTAGVSRATLYRYFPDRETLVDAVAAHALADAGARLADAGLERAPVEQAIERIIRALLAVGDRYGVLIRKRVQADPGETERLIGAPMRAVLARGIEDGLFQGVLSAQVLLELSAARSSQRPNSTSAATSALRKPARRPQPCSSTAPAHDNPPHVAPSVLRHPQRGPR